jgi:hypothetical protein
MNTKDTNDLIEIMDQLRRITNTLAEKDEEIRQLRKKINYLVVQKIIL